MVGLSSFGPLQLFRGAGNGELAGATTIANLGQSGESVVVADLNEDGKPDIAVGASEPGRLEIFLGQGNGSFRTSLVSAIGQLLAPQTLLSWHTLRHTFATHAARFGVNPWRLQAWLGHSTINMTMRYVHHVEEHHRPIPEEILAAGNAVVDPDARIVAMLGARSDFAGGYGVATKRHAVMGT